MDITFVHISVKSTAILSNVENSNNSRKKPPRLKREMETGRRKGELGHLRIRPGEKGRENTPKSKNKR